jgi:spore maturation protein CgeB
MSVARHEMRSAAAPGQRQGLRIAFYGSSLLSSYWNGAATYYRGILRALAARGHAITFFEPDVLDRQQHRDIEPPDWCRVEVYPGTEAGMRAAAARAAGADVIVKASGVGFMDDELLSTVHAAGSPGALRVWWDVDAPATLAAIADVPDHPLRRALRGTIDLVLTYGGGPVVCDAYGRLGPAPCVPVYNAVDPATHHPVPADQRLAADLSLLANRLPDREERIGEFFLRPAKALPERRFVLGGAGWDAAGLPGNVGHLGHVPTGDHNAFNASPLAVLNVNREDMATIGFSPATRIFEAAGAAACIVTDDWPGIDQFLEPGEEILVARDGQEVAAILEGLSPERARAIGARARRRVLAEHTYERRAAALDSLLRDMLERRRTEVAA